MFVCLSVCAIMLYISLKGFLRVSKTYQIVQKTFKGLELQESFKRASQELQESFKRDPGERQESTKRVPRELQEKRTLREL